MSPSFTPHNPYKGFKIVLRWDHYFRVWNLIEVRYDPAKYR